MKNIYYVYFHINPIKNEVFYVGKGYKNRAYETNRNDFYNKTIKKYGDPKIVIVKNNISEKYAFILEKAYIKIIGRRDLGLGTLTNLTDGGTGGTNSSKETRNKISKSLKGNIPWNKDKNRSKETKNKISATSKKNKNFLGKTHSDKTKNKISESLKGNIPWNKGKKYNKETKTWK